MEAIRVDGLKKNYGALKALAGIEFSVQPGEVVGFLGPNGAGKTTAMKILTGYMAASDGQAQILGHDVVSDSLAARACLGYLPESAPLYPEMTVGESVTFAAAVRGLSRGESDRAVQEALERCGLLDRRSQSVGTLSKGYRQRVGLAHALVHRPKVLILDEPTSGLDPNQIQDIRAVIREEGEKGTAVLLSTHILQEVQAVCDRVLILNQGKIVAMGTAEELSRSDRGLRVDLELQAGDGDAQAFAQGLATLDSVDRVDSGPLGDTWSFVVYGAKGADPRADLFQACVGEGQVLLGMHGVERTLEQIFREVTQEGLEP